MTEKTMINEQKDMKTGNREKLWNLNFFFLWQGQLVSCFGDVVYEIALGFWVLLVTGSTALMGTLMAASILPRVVISPFAGTLVDRLNRKTILIAADIIRGVCITLVAIAALFDFIQIWMVFAAGVILGICGAFFFPAITSSIPDIVPKSKIIAANSVFSMASTGASVVGNSAGGVMFQILGAPILFLINGLSYLVSVIMTLFIKIPIVKHEKQEFNFWEDLKDGLKFVWDFKGLRYLIIISAVINLIASMAIVLLLPLFQQDVNLGAVRYGIAGAVMTGGMLAGMVLVSVINIPASKRLMIFTFTGIVFSLMFGIFPLITNFPLMLLCLFLAGTFNSVMNTLVNAIMQLTVPQNMRGKVFSLMGMIIQGLAPLGMVIGGILAEFISIKVIICTAFAITALLFIPFALDYSFRKFINFDVEAENVSGKEI